MFNLTFPPIFLDLKLRIIKTFFSAFSINVQVDVHEVHAKQVDPVENILKSGDLDQDTLNSHLENLMSGASMDETLPQVSLSYFKFF